MFKIRFNPVVCQLRLWNTDDIGDRAVVAALTQRFSWCPPSEARLELVNRARLWRALTGDDAFDLDYYLTRETLRPTFIDPTATGPRLGSATPASQ